MGQAQTQQQVDSQDQQNEHMQYLKNNALTNPHHVLDQQLSVQFKVKCPRCQKVQFDDQLGRVTNCFNCKVLYQVNDGIVSVKDNTHFIEDKKNLSQCEIQLTFLESAIFYVNKTKLDAVLIKDGKIDYKTIINNVLIPFFSVRQRIVTQGVKFQIGPFEFLVGGGYPVQGIVTKQTEIFCYDYYSQEITNKVIILSDKHSHYLDKEVKAYMYSNPYENQIIEDIPIQINQQQLLILRCQNRSGKIDGHSLIVSAQNVPNLRQVKINCFQTPLQFEQIRNSKESMKDALLKIIILPYFKGLTRYVERLQRITIGEFEFEVIMHEDCGLVIPNQTIIEMDVSYESRPYRQAQALGFIQPSFQFQRQRQFQQQQIVYNEQSNFLNRNEQYQQHAQQIEALHRILNTFMLINESQNLLIHIQNKATQSQINQLPLRQIDLQYIKDHKFDQDHCKCMICLEEYVENENVRTMPCWHYFHQNCLDKWLSKSAICPICKTSITADISLQE